jgi:hypothetical protein
MFFVFFSCGLQSLPWDSQFEPSQQGCRAGGGR